MTVFGLAIGGLAALPGAAEAGGAATGGAAAGPVPQVRVLACRTLCAGLTTARAGSRVRVTGRALEAVESVVFQGVPGGADDVAVAPLRARRTYLDVRVPRTAATGPLAVVTSDGAESAPSPAPVTIDAAAAPPAQGSGPGIDIEVQGNRVFYGSERQAQVSYLVRDAQPVKVRIELIRASDGVAVMRWEPGIVQPNTPQTISWDGTAGGRVQRDGRYEFRIFAESQSGTIASSSQAPPGAPASPGSFLFQRHKFPVGGPHDYGGPAAAFGGGRGHQGQDVFAKCGTPLVAARGGVVEFKQYHSRAGHYLVIDGDATGYDYAYMHLRDAALVNQGDHVYTGQPIGFVGDTGHAEGCHLHFEMWRAPGWYKGGQPFDPLPQLQLWDKAS